jgi:hypothetical protein
MTAQAVRAHHRLGPHLAGAAVVGVVLVVWFAPARAQASAVVAQPPPDLMRQVVPGEGAGEFPTSHYDIGYDAGAWNDFDRKILGFLTALTFGAVRWLVDVGLWVITWAYTFGFANELAEPAGAMAATYNESMLGPMGLAEFALLCAVAYAGWQVLRGRLPRGAGELAVSLVVATVGTIALKDPAAVMDSGLSAASRLSGDVLAVAAHEPNGSGSDSAASAGRYVRGEYGAALGPLKAAIHRAYVAEPNELINWGELLDGNCAELVDRVLETGPHGADDEPRTVMGSDPACERYASFNADPTFERLGAALLVLIAAAISVVLLVLVAGTVVVAQLIGIALIALMPFALVGGIFPGGGRQLLWRWVVAALRVLIVIVAMALFLSFLLLSMTGLLDATKGRSLLERFGILVILTVVAFVARKRVVRAGQSITERWGRRLETARVGGTGGASWLRPAAVGGATGFGIAQLSDEARAEMRQVTKPAARATRAVTGPARGHNSLQRVSAARPVRAGAAVARATRGAARIAANSTINLPVKGPRAAAKATAATSAAAERVRARLGGRAETTRDWARHWKRGAAHPAASFRAELGRARAGRAGKEVS